MIAGRSSETESKGIGNPSTDAVVIPHYLSREGAKLAVLGTPESAYIESGVRQKLLLGLEHVNHLLDTEVDIDQFLSHIVSVTAENTMADYVALITRDEGTGEWFVKAEKGELSAVCRRMCHEVMVQDGLRLFENSTSYLPCIDRLIVDSTTVALMCVPLIVDSRLAGGITLARTGDQSRFGSSDASLAAILGQWASLKLANIGLLKDLAERRSHEQRLLTEICRTQEEERRRVAAELHDGVAQWMVSAAYDISACQTLLSSGDISDPHESLERVKSTLQTCIKELRRAISNLRPLPIAELGLLGALNQAIHAMKNDGVDCSINVWGDLPEMSLAEENTIYWIVQEAMNNIRKHAMASRVILELQFDGSTFSIRILDNGIGFDVESFDCGSGALSRMGLVGMRERADLLGGTLRVSSQPNSGTEVLLSFRHGSYLSSASGGR